MSSTTARHLVMVVLVWAAIYLPWLGTSGLRSEEGHRVLPAVAMIESGDYLIPRIGGQPYLRKPPLINWLVAAAFRLSPFRNEWSARMPSALAVLGLALAFLSVRHGTLGDRGSLFAAFAWLTSLGMMEKGRMIEIEALYVSLFGFAFLSWFKCWRECRPPWLTWTVPWVFLGLGMLAKGPALLLFFYAVVAAILWPTKRLRDLILPAHLVGLLIMFAIFAAWAVPYLRAVDSQRIAQTWTGEIVSRATGADPTFHDWPLNFPLGLAYFLPFALLLPFIRISKFPADDQPIAMGLLLGSALPFCVVLVFPGAMPRYILPTLVPACCLFGMAVNAGAFAWNLSLGKFRPQLSPRLLWTLVCAIAICAAIIFQVRSATVQKARPGYNVDAEPVNAALPVGEVLYAVDPGYQPLLFYVRAPVRYVRRLEQLPPEARYVLIRSNRENEMESDPGRAHLIARLKGVRGQQTLFYGLNPAE